jgi:GR25 family glycosyltransferase involved in LPS biosynthesis/predicted O-methyltransferase YrrM
MEYFHWGIEGWFDAPQSNIYAEMVKSAKDGAHFVEIGAWKGKSTSFMAVEIKNSGKKIKFDVVDTFKGSPEHQNLPCIINDTLYQEYLSNIEPVKKYVNTIVGDSSNIAGMYADDSLDFVFIDGDHTLEGVRRDIMAWFDKVKPGGYLCGNDVFQKGHDGVHQAIMQLLDNVDIYQNNWIYKKPKIVEHLVEVNTDTHLSVYNNYDTIVDCAYVITLPGNETSEKCTARCVDSLNAVGMKYELFPGFDGTDRKVIKTPDHLKDQQWIKWIKVADHLLSPSEIACAMSHIALWAHCVSINKPIVILEHDALMLKKYTKMPGLCCVDTLGHMYWTNEAIAKLKLQNISMLQEYLKENELHTFNDFPFLNVANENYLYQLGQHAYAIDPYAAKKLLTTVINQGLTQPNDTLVNINDIAIITSGFFAAQNTNAFDESTIRPETLKRYDIENFDHRKPTCFVPGVSRIVKNSDVMQEPAWNKDNGDKLWIK